MAKAVLTRVPVEAYASALAPLGVEVVAMEVTHQHATPDDMRATARAIVSGPYAATVVTSRTAAIWLRTGVITAGAELEISDLGEIWAVGPATQRALVANGDPQLPARWPQGTSNAAELARAMLASRSFAGERVLIPRAEDGRTEAIEILRAGGAVVVDVVAYRTTPVDRDSPNARRGRELLEHHAADLCCVFAPSQVAALAGIAGPLAQLGTQFVAIGETTAAALRAAGVEPRVAATPTPEGLAQAIALHLRPA